MKDFATKRLFDIAVNVVIVVDVKVENLTTRQQFHILLWCLLLSRPLVASAVPGFLVRITGLKILTPVCRPLSFDCALLPRDRLRMVGDKRLFSGDMFLCLTLISFD